MIINKGKYQSENFDSLRLALEDIGINELRKRIFNTEKEELNSFRLYLNSKAAFVQQDIWNKINKG